MHLQQASTEYANRPADERFATFDAMIADAEADRANSIEKSINLRDLKAVPDDDGGLLLRSPSGQHARFSHWSFGQLSRTIGAPAGYLRSLPPALASDCVNHGLREGASYGTVANLLVRAPLEGESLPLVRAATSETYGRAWDAELYGELRRHFGDGQRSAAGTWQAPPVWPGARPGGQYRGDRSSFVIRIDGGSIVTDPRGWSALGTSQQGGGLHRGILARNSEVGGGGLHFECVLFDIICGNHLLWGAIIDRKFMRRHVGKNVVRDVVREIQKMAMAFNGRSAAQDEAIIRALVTHNLAATEAGVIDELRALGFAKDDAQRAVEVTTAQESAFSPLSFWGLAAGVTRMSQESGYQDERHKLDTLAAAILKRGAKVLA